MNLLITQSTPMALWYDIIHDAQKRSGILLQQDLESYLILLLMRYIKRPDLAKQIMACELLESLKWLSAKRLMALQEVGDKCLLFSGLFPRRTEKKLVKISYFVSMGQSAYGSISRVSHDLFESLAKDFVPLMDVLQTVCDTPLLPIEAYDLWNETHSQRALSALRQYTQAIPVLSKK